MHLECSRRRTFSAIRHSNGRYAEDIAWISDTRLHPDVAARMFIELWTNSPGHFANMTNGRYREVGIGLFLDDGGWGATQLFR